MNSPQYPSEQKQERFERYLMHQMNAQEEAAFKQALQADADFSAEFTLFKELVRTVEEEALRANLEDFHKELPAAKKTAPRTKSNVIWYSVAAGITFLVGLSIWFFTRQPFYERLYASYYQPDPGLPTVMGPESDYDFYEAMVVYKQGEYEDARRKWETLTAKTKTTDTLNYFIASAYMAENEQSQAIVFFKKVLQSPEASFDAEAYYYLGLAYLKLGERDLAAQNLKQSGTEASKQLLQELND